MSGQPYKTQIDMANAREAYLANLKLRAELDDKNLQANKIYVKTGQLPVELKDTRTTTEKLADIRRLKIDIASKLSEIADGENAQSIANQLTTDQMQFLAQNFQPIKEQIKKMYSLGVLAPIFIDYLNRYMDKYAQTRGVELGLQQVAGNQLLANQRTIMNTLASKQDLDYIITLIRDLGIDTSAQGRDLLMNINNLHKFTGELPLVFDAINQQNNEIIKNQILQTLNAISDELPTKLELATALYVLEQNIASKNIEGIKTSLIALKNLTETGSDVSEQIEILNKLLGQSGIPPLKESAKLPPPQQGSANLPPPNFPVPISEARKAAIISNYKTTDKQLTNKKLRQDYIRDMSKYLLKDENNKDIDGLIYNRKVFRAYAPWIIDIYGRNINDISLGELGDAVSKINNQLSLLVPELYQDRKMSGKGLVRVRPSQVFKTDIDSNTGIIQAPKFAKIGRYLINKRQLDKDIIAIKRPAGSTIHSLPSQRVSRNLGNIMRKIIGNGIPTFDELNTLTDEERLYLHKVAKETRIDDKLNIPTPKKDEEEKEINEFEILKGQILAGNDNKDVIKKFKALILKLSRKDLIPKAQVKDLLIDLVALGH